MKFQKKNLRMPTLSLNSYSLTLFRGENELVASFENEEHLVLIVLAILTVGKTMKLASIS